MQVNVGTIQGNSPNFRVSIKDNTTLKMDSDLRVNNQQYLPFPAGTTNDRPTEAVPGTLFFNTTINAFEIFDGDLGTWEVPSLLVTQPDGSTSASAVSSARSLYENGIVTSGKGYRWINTSNGARQVWCDFDTKDKNGMSGWMLVASFGEGRYWGGDSNNVYTTSSAISPVTTPYRVTANMWDDSLQMFRITSSGNIPLINNGNTLGQNADADWYYYWDDAIKWKEVWAPADDQHYMSSSAQGLPQRTCIRQFNSSYNIKWSYECSNHKWNNLSDFGYQNSKSTNSEYSYGSIGGSTAPGGGWAYPWGALQSSGSQFEWYYVGRNASYGSRSGGDSDGTLGIPTSGSSADTTGQDVDTNIGAKVGNDDNVDWGGATTNGSTNAGNNGAISTVPLWWWIK